MVYLFAILIYSHRYDMQVLPFDVLVLEYDIGLLSVTELFHKLLCQQGELFLGKVIFRRWIEGYMDDRVTHMGVEGDVRGKSPDAVFYGDVSLCVRCYFGMSEHLCRTVIHFDFIVGNHSIE